MNITDRIGEVLVDLPVDEHFPRLTMGAGHVVVAEESSQCLEHRCISFRVAVVVNDGVAL